MKKTSKNLGVPASKAKRSDSAPSSPKKAERPATSSRIEQLEAVVQATRIANVKAIDKLDAEKRRIELPKVRTELVGKCFRYRNSYGVSNPKPFWTYKVVEDVVDIVNGAPRIKAMIFDIDSEGRVTFYREKWSYLGNGWSPITPAQLERAFTKACAAIGSMYGIATGSAKATPKKKKP